MRDEASAVLDEIVASEAAYVRDLERSCAVLAALRPTGTLTKEDEGRIFGNLETIRGINVEMLTRVRAATATADAVGSTAGAFIAMAPFLKGYAHYCSNFVWAQECMGKLLRTNQPLERAVRAAEAEVAMGERLDSLLIKPVQRLCKYPLLLRELGRAADAHGPATRRLVDEAQAAIDGAARAVNERVRAAEGQCELIALAEAAAEPELVTPTRSIILHVPGLAVQKQGSASSPMSPTKRRELDLWLCTDVLLLGERGGGGGVTIDHRAEIARTTLEPVALAPAGPSALRLSAADGGVRVLWASRATADGLLAAFGAAKASVSAATTHTTRDARAREALAEISERRDGSRESKLARVASRRAARGGSSAGSFSTTTGSSRRSDLRDLADTGAGSFTARMRSHGSVASEQPGELECISARSFGLGGLRNRSFGRANRRRAASCAAPPVPHAANVAPAADPTTHLRRAAVPGGAAGAGMLGAIGEEAALAARKRAATVHVASGACMLRDVHVAEDAASTCRHRRVGDGARGASVSGADRPEYPDQMPTELLDALKRRLDLSGLAQG